MDNIPSIRAVQPEGAAVSNPTSGNNGIPPDLVPTELTEPDDEGILVAMISRATRKPDYGRERDTLKRLTFTHIEALKRILVAKERALFEAVGPILLEDEKRKGSY